MGNQAVNYSVIMGGIDRWRLGQEMVKTDKIIVKVTIFCSLLLWGKLTRDIVRHVEIHRISKSYSSIYVGVHMVKVTNLRLHSGNTVAGLHYLQKYLGKQSRMGTYSRELSSCYRELEQFFLCTSGIVIILLDFKRPQNLYLPLVDPALHKYLPRTCGEQGRQAADTISEVF